MHARIGTRAREGAFNLQAGAVDRAMLQRCPVAHAGQACLRSTQVLAGPTRIPLFYLQILQRLSEPGPPVRERRRRFDRAIEVGRLASMRGLLVDDLVPSHHERQIELSGGGSRPSLRAPE